MVRKPPTGPHADVAERFAFLLDALDLDRAGFVARVDGAVSARSLFAILAGDRRPSRSLAVLVERTFGFRADHLLHGTGPMWAQTPDVTRSDLTPDEERLLTFARRSIDNARLLSEQLEQAEAWEALWTRATAMLTELERAARHDDAQGYPDTATQVLDECWRMAEAFRAWTSAHDQRRVVHLTMLFVRRFLVQVPDELRARGALTQRATAKLQTRARNLLAQLAEDQDQLDDQIARTVGRIDRLSAAPPRPVHGGELGERLDALITRIDRLRPSPL